MAAMLACAPLGRAYAEPAARPTPSGARAGWTEIVLRDGTRALVPASDARAESARAPASPVGPRRTPDAARAAAARRGPTTIPTGLAPSPGPETASVAALRTEVARLRGVVDELTALEATLDRRASASPPPPAGAVSWLAVDSWTALAAALAAGVLIGGALQRYRARRARTLRF